MVKIEEVILIIVFLVAVGTGVWYVFGDSPTLEQGLIIFLLSSVMGIVIIITKVGIRVEYFEKNQKHNGPPHSKWCGLLQALVFRI